MNTSPLVETVETLASPLSLGSAAAVADAIMALSPPALGLPVDALVRFGAAVSTPLTLDIESMRRIGIPILVLREQKVAEAPISLTRRERDVARLVAAGRRNREIARALGVSLATVKDHVHNILERTGLQTRTALAAAVIRRGL